MFDTKSSNVYSPNPKPVQVLNGKTDFLKLNQFLSKAHQLLPKHSEPVSHIFIPPTNLRSLRGCTGPAVLPKKTALVSGPAPFTYNKYKTAPQPLGRILWGSPVSLYHLSSCCLSQSLRWLRVEAEHLTMLSSTLETRRQTLTKTFQERSLPPSVSFSLSALAGKAKRAAKSTTTKHLSCSKNAPSCKRPEPPLKTRITTGG